jgi:hypothetical protein
VEGSACQLQYVQSLNLENSDWVENQMFSVLFCLKRCKEKAGKSKKTEEKNTCIIGFFFFAFVTFLWLLWLFLFFVFLEYLAFIYLVCELSWWLFS